jgi:hypothetical protein
MPRRGYVGPKEDESEELVDALRLRRYNQDDELWSTHWFDVVHYSDHGVYQTIQETMHMTPMTRNPTRIPGSFFRHRLYNGYWVTESDVILDDSIYFEYNGYITSSGRRTNCFFKLRRHEVDELDRRFLLNEESQARRPVIYTYLMNHF